ncbi:MAG: hypothetical protein KDD34_05260 [Bdellovibrionales bacterium]|nr:hypothetical protein [Bdellovibrionales bacterium]
MKFNQFTKCLALIGTMTWAATVSAQAFDPIAGCTDASFIDGGSENIINTSGASYTPKCLRVRVGAFVTIEATQHHPLAAMPDIDGALNPFASESPSVIPITQQMNSPGFYGYFCTRHGDEEGDGMAGVIEVVP